MAAVVPWMLGEDLTNVTVVGYYADDAGNLSAGDSYVVTAYVDTLDESSDPEMENIRPVNSRRRHMVPTEDPPSTVRIVTIKRSDVAQDLDIIRRTYRYAKVSWVEGASAFTTWHSVGRYEGGGVQGHGKNTCGLTFEPIDVGSDQMVVA